FVVANLAAFEHDWSLDPVEFRTAVALHEVTHRIEFGRPWMPDRFRSLVDDFLSTLTIDVSAIQERFASLDPADPEAMQRAFGGEDGAVFGAVLDPEQRIKLGRIQAFVAAIVDERVWDAHGESSPDGIYLTGQPGPALAFVMFRAWKVGVGIVQEEVRLFGPSGRMVWRWGPAYRRMEGMFDLTTEVDVV